MSSNSNDISPPHKNVIEGEVEDSRPTGCMFNLLIKKGTNIYRHAHGVMMGRFNIQKTYQESDL